MIWNVFSFANTFKLHCVFVWRWCTWRRRRCSALSRWPQCCWLSWRRQLRVHWRNLWLTVLSLWVCISVYLQSRTLMHGNCTFKITNVFSWVLFKILKHIKKQLNRNILKYKSLLLVTALNPVLHSYDTHTGNVGNTCYCSLGPVLLHRCGEKIGSRCRADRWPQLLAAHERDHCRYAPS